MHYDLTTLPNGLRVISIVLIDYALGRELDLTGHAYVGWVANGLGHQFEVGQAPVGHGVTSWNAVVTSSW